MSELYKSGIAREAVVMHNRGQSIDEICRVLRVDRQFVGRAIEDKHRHIIEKDIDLDYSTKSDICGY